MRELYRSAHIVVTVDDERRLVRRVRTGHGYASVAEVEFVYETMLRKLDSIDRRLYGLLVDVRLAPPRNDDTFEQVVERHLQGLYSGYRRVAILVKTEAGRLQMKRLARQRSLDLAAFVDEAAALSYVTEKEKPGPRL
jgi:hypothetical protein